MEQIAKVFSIGLPIFAVLILGEKLYGYLKGNDTVPWMDAMSSSYSGITFLTRLLLGFSITIVSYKFLYEHIALFHLESTWLVYAIAFVVIDFQGYWGHRLVHEINFLWNRHLIHHSSEEFNLACALRQSISDFVHVLFFLSVPAALIGLSPTIIAIMLPIHQFSQYWYHTRHINKLGFLEHVIVTPSHHRVHHALNPIYLDKNYSPIFIIWDKLFGTFQAELESEPPVYGITRPSQSYNPITINFEHFALMLKDAWRAENWIDKITIWFRPTGWRPVGFEEKYPVTKITEPYNFEKFNPPTSKGLLIWNLFQFFTFFFFVIYVVSHIGTIGLSGLYIFAIFVFVQVFSTTELMNQNKWAPVFSFISSVVCLAILFYDRSWFGVNSMSDLLPTLFLFYFILQTVMSFAFSRKTETFNFENLQRA